MRDKTLAALPETHRARDEARAARTDEAMPVSRAQADPHAFAPLYVRYFDPVHFYCRRELGDPEAAADATSQVFTKALAALPRYRAGSFRSWLFAIAHNVVVDELRQHGPHASLEEAVDIVDTWPTPEERALAAEAQRAVIVLLAGLTPEQRRVVALRLAGLTGQEIADVLQLSLPAVKSLQFRAATRLRRLLGGEDSISNVEDAHAPQ